MRRAWAFLPFLVVVGVHLGALLAGATALSGPSKTALMPALLLALLIALPTLRSEVALWGGLGVALSGAGDVLLGDPGQLGFLLGLGAFLLAHVAYLLLYARPLRRRRPGWPALVFAVWWVVLLVVLIPHVGVLAAPVVLYGLVLCGAAAVALGTTPLVATGAVLFLVSDTLLALRFFLPGFGFVQQDAVIMFFYLAGQGLIVAGAVLAEQRRLAPGAPVA